MATAPTAPDITNYLYRGDPFPGFDSMQLAWGFVVEWFTSGLPDQGNTFKMLEYVTGGLG